MADELKERAHALLHAHHIDIAYSDRAYDAIVDAIAALLAEVRTERLPCGHMPGEVQGKDGGTRWCAGCEREAGIRAGVIEESAQVAERVARANSKLSRDMEDHDLLAAFYRHRAIAIAVREVEAQIRALTPADYVAVRREDMPHLLGDCDCFEPRGDFRGEAEAASRHHDIINRIRAALSRARKGE